MPSPASPTLTTVSYTHLDVYKRQTLHEQLQTLAEQEAVSLNHYIVYALTRQATLA